MSVSWKNFILAVVVATFVAIVVCGCTRKVYVPIHSSELVVDTVVEKVADSSIIKALFDCDSNNQVVLRELREQHGLHSSGSVEVDSAGSIEVTTRWKTRYVERLRYVRDTTVVVEFRDVVHVEKHVPRFFWVCFVVAALTVCYLGWRVASLLRR